MARPRKQIDADQVERLAKINCSMEEIGSVVGCSVDTLERRFAEVVKKGRSQGRMSLKHRMYQTAMEVDKNGYATRSAVTMQIWLSKQTLGYSDKVAETSVSEVKHEIVYDTQFGDPPSSAKNS